MSKTRPRVVLVGAGGYGRLYVEALTSQDMGAELTAICDIDPNLAERVPQIRQRQIPVYPTLDAFFAKDSADLAVLVSPVHFHTDMVLSCLEHGVNVLCEKPLCLTVKEAAAMQEASKKTGKFLCIGYQLNYRRDVQALKRDILLGRFGKAKHIAVYHGFRRGAAYYARNNWAGRITCQGREVFDSPFTNACAHHFQMLTFLLGPTMRTACDIESVQAELYRANPTIENYDIAALRFQTAQGLPLLYYTAVDSGDPPFCGVEADLPHIHAVRLVQQNPITPVRSELVQPVHTDTDDFYCVKNLEQMLVHCAENRALPSELGIQLG